MHPILTSYSTETAIELQNILDYWMHYTQDEVNGGFYGKVDAEDQPDLLAPKGSVLNSRILWTFSAAYLLKKDAALLIVAKRAYQYLLDHFIDKEFGGVFWTVDAVGNPLDSKKQVYALAFALYGFSEYHRANPSVESMEVCINLYDIIETYSFDQKDGGYFEAFTRDWKKPDDLRLSDKDANEKKSMNTHLHVLEAYTNFYRIRSGEQLRIKIASLVNIFIDHIINPDSFHLHLFFDEAWNVRSDIISFGHDIEAAWLVQEAAEIIGYEGLISEVKRLSVKMVEAAIEGLDVDGGLWYENDISQNHYIKEKHWWPQAEAMVGFLHAWKQSGNKQFFDHSLNSWQFVKKNLKDRSGEWVWGINEDDSRMENQDKAGLWKCPYHNGRACMEVIKRLG